MKSTDRRRAEVEAELQRVGESTFSSLARRFDVSEMTIRRDAEALEARGVVRRVLGGVIASGTSREPSAGLRESSASLAKAAIAEAAAGLLRPGETVILDGGTSVLAFARALHGRRLGLTVLTPNLPVAQEMVQEEDATVIVLGGQLRQGELSTTGAEVEEALRAYRCDAFVMGVAGVSPDHGLSDYNRGDAAVKRAALRSSDRTIALVDADKLGRVQFAKVGDLDETVTIVTDAPETHDVAIALSARGITVLHA